jgi:hypothetical protein
VWRSQTTNSRDVMQPIFILAMLAESAIKELEGETYV